MIDRAKSTITKIINIVPIVCSVLVLCGFIGAGAYYTYKNKPSLTNTPKTVIKDSLADAKKAATEVATDPEAEQKTEEFTKNPPKTSSGNLSKKTVSTPAGSAMVVSTGGTDDTSKVQSLANKAPVSTFTYVDKTGNYPELGGIIQNYLNDTLLHGNEISYMYEVDLIDCADCSYGGYWTGSYIYQGNDITKAFGYITLNIGPYRDSNYKTDYMKLIFSHEYGHQYTMYHRWVDLDIPSAERFPDQYYSLRPLTYGDTATDYSLGWANCDSEIIAEDYSYFYSGYGYSGIASAHGYPSNPATKNYLVSLSGAAPVSDGNPPAETPPSDETPAPEADNTAPTVSISAPANGSLVQGNTQISAAASDNVAVAKVDFYVDNQLASTDNSSPYSSSWDTTATGDGAHTLTAKAYDSAGNYATSSISVNVSNSEVSDNTAPIVTISEPGGSTYNWTSGNLRIHATATDNVAVTKIQFYINDVMVAEDSSAEIIRIWMNDPTPAGTYILTAKAYDAAGNTSETSITIIKS